MLTEKENEWLERRKNPCNRCGFQKNCSWKSQNIPCEKWGLFEIKAWGTKSGYVEHNFRDAARFYALALEFLARPKPSAFIHFEGFSEGTKMCGRYDPRHGCRPCELRRAMLRAEKDMEGKHA